MIVVVGRPETDDEGHLTGTAARIGLAALDAGGRVELVGSVPDNDRGDAAVTQLGRAGIGHAAVLRDPSGAPVPRLDAADLDLALRYLAECQVLVVAEQLPPDALAVVSDAAEYHGAAVVTLSARADGQPALPTATTVLETPDEDSTAFTTLIGRYAARLDAGVEPALAWRESIAQVGWEQSVESQADG